MPYTASTITDPALDALYELLRLYRGGPLAVACPVCPASVGEPCRRLRRLHCERRSRHDVAIGAHALILELMGITTTDAPS
ncbi:zinc finger domain-containing protein [Streptomyces melanogenes]|uniref:zinc finger domain-containing protein n=1 Tax=Streptomyces melanogenes TaxID=67326 RepID=UPI00167E013E|nr:hypothetical protein [Streptomyces melanogenes]GGP78455.1 hypothetical protein GCM10010278_66110 [Streptomyces melanogenes]